MDKHFSSEETNILREKAKITIGLKDVLVDCDLPFKPSFKYYYYIEPYRDPQINKYFRSHLDAINSKMEDNNQILYLPLFVENELIPIVEYNRPGISNSTIEALNSNVSQFQKIYNQIQSHIKDVSSAKIKVDYPFLLHYEYSSDISDYRFSLYPLLFEDEIQFSILLNSILEVPDYYRPHIMCSTIEEYYEIPNRRKKHIDDVLESCIRETPDYDWADKQSITDIASEIQERINKLQLMGVSDFVIRNLIKIPEAKLSPLLITPNYHIILPAYNNMEIEMPTLSKVVYFFYLRHPRGLRFKELIDYRSELLKIYCTISNRENTEKMEQSINELVDSTRNSINEKCSRIRAAFVTKFSDDLAHHYYVTGNYATPKLITLDRNMLIDKSGITII